MIMRIWSAQPDLYRHDINFQTNIFQSVLFLFEPIGCGLSSLFHVNKLRFWPVLLLLSISCSKYSLTCKAALLLPSTLFLPLEDCPDPSPSGWARLGLGCVPISLYLYLWKFWWVMVFSSVGSGPSLLSMRNCTALLSTVLLCLASWALCLVRSHEWRQERTMVKNVVRRIRVITTPNVASILPCNRGGLASASKNRKNERSETDTCNETYNNNIINNMRWLQAASRLLGEKPHLTKLTFLSFKDYIWFYYTPLPLVVFTSW